MRPMLKRHHFLAAAAALCAAGPAAAEKISLPALSAYLNGVKTARAPFTQVSDDGSLATGTLYLMRPGRARFEYDRFVCIETSVEQGFCRPIDSVPPKLEVGEDLFDFTGTAAPAQAY